MRLARDYGLFRPDFILSAEEMVLADNYLLNELIKAENKAQEEAIQKRKEKDDHPGMERYEDPEDFWAEVDAANKESTAPTDTQR
jgi:hypothetical protein